MLAQRMSIRMTASLLSPRLGPASQLAHGANPSPPDAGYSTPVALSVRRGQLPALRALLEAGADANQPDYQGKWGK